ncbi:hypothetical protein [Massilimicrobiota timonensis]|uniref:hypothetical protein n=1 Tax=Massilimicrobiota timonensis TaxID=1776392 RepID=UPI00101D7CAA|nr:hypothetical protein [Massilimicrobiota timonensis]
MLENQNKNFAEHVASFQDFGNIKVLDFQRPNSSFYQIRFIFEEDKHVLHISGDLGELIASNNPGLTFERFMQDYCNDVQYFESKVKCCSRPIYSYNKDDAKEDIIDMLSQESMDEGLIEDVLVDYSSQSGLSIEGIELLQNLLHDDSDYHKIGKRSTGILDIYLLAFKLAMEQLTQIQK